LQSPLAAQFSAPVFKAGAHVFSLGDILAAAEARGDMAGFREEWEKLRATAAQAEADGLSPDEEAVAAASNAFRYARDLVTAEECERWLAQRGLTFEDLTASFTRRLQAELVIEEEAANDSGAALPDRTSPHPSPLPSFRRSGEGNPVAPSDETPHVGSSEDAEEFCRDALLADEFTEWARGLAWRVALAVEEASLPQPLEWEKLEEGFAAACETFATPERQRRELAVHRLELTRLAVVAAEFDSVAAAREAFLCAQEDGTPMEEIAQANGFPTERYERLWEDFTPDWQAALLSVTPGGVGSPLPHGEGFTVLQLLDKREPTLEAADVRTRLAKNLERRFFGELEAKHIRWLLNVEVET
jgi:hypothetical protein